jgi:hypothetical protein
LKTLPQSARNNIKLMKTRQGAMKEYWEVGKSEQERQLDSLRDAIDASNGQKPNVPIHQLQTLHRHSTKASSSTKTTPTQGWSCPYFKEYWEVRKS